MPRHLTNPSVLAVALMTLLAVSACGGGNDDGSSEPSDSGSERATSSANGGATTGQGSATPQGSTTAGAMTVSAPTQNANPGQSWADVDGRRLSYEASGSIYYTCIVGTDQIAVNYQMANGHDFALTAMLQNGQWFGSVLFQPGEQGNVQFGGVIPSDVTVLGVGPGALSYEGTVDKVVDFDVTNAQTMDVTIAINCESPGGDPTATIDGTTYVFPASGAQSFDCRIADDDLEVRVNRLAIDDLQLEIDASVRTPGGWLGHVVVYAGDARFTSTVPADGEGLTIDGATLIYEGAFVSKDGGEFDGTVEVACS